VPQSQRMEYRVMQGTNNGIPCAARFQQWDTLCSQVPSMEYRVILGFQQLNNMCFKVPAIKNHLLLRSSYDRIPCAIRFNYELTYAERF
jgi:hypothetical protein